MGVPGRFLSAQQLVKLYEEHGGEIFEQSLWRKVRSVGGILEEAYSHEALEAILDRYFGERALSACSVPTMVTSYDIQHRRTVFLKSWHGDHAGLSCKEAARATSAAPTYFEPTILEWASESRTLIDGGVFMNSPSVSAYAEAQKLFPDDEIAMLSIGTGELTRAIPYEAAKTWGSALWVMSLLDCMFDGVSKAADHQMRLFLGENYLRLQTPLHYASDDMDDASKGNIRNLRQTAEELIQREESHWTTSSPKSKFGAVEAVSSVVVALGLNGRALAGMRKSFCRRADLWPVSNCLAETCSERSDAS